MAATGEHSAWHGRSGAYRRDFDADSGAHYSADEVEFMLAIDRYKREHDRPHPDCRDVLRVLKQLGYRKAK